jgi:multidrug resistance efflux pump
MEILLLLIYSFFVWLIFFKFKWLPWNIVSQVITGTIPVIALTILILLLNIFAPSSSDVRVINYVIQIVPRVAGRVTEVPIEPNRPIKKGDVLFRIDPTPFEQDVRALEAQIAGLNAKLADAASHQVQLRDQLRSASAKRDQSSAKVISAHAYHKELQEQLRSAKGKKESIQARLELARKREGQARELAAAGAGPGYDLEQAASEVKSLEADLAAATAAEAQIAQKLSARAADGEFADVAQAKADLAAAAANQSQVAEELSAKAPSGDATAIAEVRADIARAEAQLAEARWNLEQTTTYAPADGVVVNLQLRPGSSTSTFVGQPVMSFVEQEQWVLMLFDQNELRQIEDGNEAEISLETHPNKIIKCKVDSIVWSTGQGQLPISGRLPETGTDPVPPGRFAVRLAVEGHGDPDLFLAPGARGAGAIYTNSGHMIHIIRKVLLRVHTKVDWLILKLH